MHCFPAYRSCYGFKARQAKASVQPVDPFELSEETVQAQEIVERYTHDGYVVVDDLFNDSDLDPMRDFISCAVDTYSHQQFANGRLNSLHDDEPFERRYAAICEELEFSARDWSFGTFGPEFYGLYTHPEIVRVVSLLLGDEVTVVSSPSLRTKLPGSTITAFPWHQDSHYFDQAEVGNVVKRTQNLHMVSVWLPLVDATVDNGCCWVIPGSHRWGLLDAARGDDRNVRIGEQVEERGTPVPVPLRPGGAFFFSNLCVHASTVNTTQFCRWSIDFRYIPTPTSAALDARQRSQAEFVERGSLDAGDVPFVVLPENERPTWDEWQASVHEHRRTRMAAS